jgi:nicotinate phosphoribosyltransferase
MVAAAGGRPLIEAGGRRTHEWAAPAAGRAAYLAGFASSTNLEAGRRYGVPTGGTTGHAFVLAHPDEAAAFAAQASVTGPAITALVDTFDIEAGIATAVAVFGPDLGAIRIDSGDLGAAAQRARQQLDRLGATGTRIVVSGDLDEHRIAALAGAPIDRMLVGTEVVTGAGAATAGLVYKLVAIADRPGEHAPLRPVAKRSPGKATRLGHRVVHRRIGESGTADADLLTRPEQGPPLAGPGTARPLHVVWVSRGAPVAGRPDLHDARQHCRRSLAELPPEALGLDPGLDALEVVDLGAERG